MKKTAFLILGLAFLCGIAYAVDKPKVLTNDGAVKTEPGVVYQMVVAFDNVRAGDRVDFKNSLDVTADSGNTLIFSVIAPSTKSTIYIPAWRGVNFSTGIYADFSITTGAATATTLYE